MTISDATPHNPAAGSLEEMLAGALGTVSSVHFTIGPEASPTEAVDSISASAALVLPRLLHGAPEAAEKHAMVQDVLTELVDITARHKASLDLVVHITYDGEHILVSAGDMDRPLPAPEEEPGLYLVNRIATEISQHAGDNGGRITWAAIDVRR
ncbi:hypothetical protein [Streptomyces griseomycini]|uniref:Histidine kinase/HSP90-like ATPase domain-containing protein n=1 Tax=Streptomyces griseomycini TaxID=66895 RepID=A0A7W7PWK8_9ACTN|nr:hypothetical protein [Streptomyces griseomycini]MBB4902614.1 hypothetical protein [Streptomyces griseomycini]GGR54471.1 hypothetical protein GCM10015536_69840 [Streptomyces griseomycini]